MHRLVAEQFWCDSNHGGRNLDTSPPAILILLDLHRNAPHVFDKLEVYVDGGIRRGTDILKAICLGATAVSLGRPFLYSLNYGTEGVEYLIDSKLFNGVFSVVEGVVLMRLGSVER